MPDIEIPWGTLKNPEELEEWINDDDDRRDQAWEDHRNGAAKKWLIAAVEPDQSIFIATEELQSRTYPVGEDWGEGAAEDIEEWVLGCFSDYTGLSGELIPRVAIEFDLDDEGCLCEITGFGILAYVAEINAMTTWLANFDGFSNSGDGDGWWLEFGYDGAE
jgi:hypothetical protein